jgi:hypothetical protein
MKFVLALPTGDVTFAQVEADIHYNTKVLVSVLMESFPMSNSKYFYCPQKAVIASLVLSMPRIRIFNRVASDALYRHSRDTNQIEITLSISVTFCDVNRAHFCNY